MEKTERFNEITTMRVLAMTMIVAFHSMCFYNGRWVKVHAITIPFWEKVSTFLDVIDLNMFVFISGYLFGYLYIYKNKYRNPLAVIHNKATRLLIPYLFWGIPMAAIWPWNTWSKLLYGIGHLWFLLMLFGVFALTVFFQLLKGEQEKFTVKADKILIVISFLFGYVFFMYIYRGDILCVNKILFYFPAFALGYLSAKMRIGWLLPNWAYIVLPFAVIALFVSVWYPLPFPSILVLMIRNILAYVICIDLLIILSKETMSDRTQRVFHEVERLSMGLYIFNQIMMDIVFTTPFLHKWFEAHWMVGPFLLFLIGFFPPLLLSYIFNKYKWLKWTIGS